MASHLAGVGAVTLASRQLFQKSVSNQRGHTHSMLRTLKKVSGKLQLGLVVGALVATALGPAAPSAAQTAPTASITFDQANYNVASVAAGNAITVNVNATTTGTVRGWQFGLSWNASVLSLTSVT